VADKSDDRPEWAKGTAVLVPTPEMPIIVQVTPELLGSLAEDLLKAARTFAKTDPEGNNWRRLGAAQAVNSIVNFLGNSGFPTALFSSLLLLNGALIDANEGRANSLLQADKYKGGAKKGAMESIYMAQIAAVVTFLTHDLRWEVKTAIRRAAAAAKIPHKKLGDFRKNVMARRAPRLAIEAYWETLNDMRKRPNTDEERHARGEGCIESIAMSASDFRYKV
jgi:hypothetical protein